MIIRKHMERGCQSEAEYSDCDRYRYSLTRKWNKNGRRVMFLMLNPSTATELKNDPTVARCERRAYALGFGTFRVTNIFAWRETDPKEMRAVADPIGHQNDRAILNGARWADQIITAWGAHGAHLERGRAVENLLRANGHSLYHFGLTQTGHPRHPLYLAYAKQPEIWHPTPYDSSNLE